MSHTITQTRRKNPMWFYEQNYGLLLAIIPGLKSPKMCGYVFDSDSIHMQVDVAETSPYTCLLTVEINFKQYMQLSPIQMHVRIYNDAALAEVVAYQQLQPLTADFLRPGRQPFDVDNKRQANLLLHEALHYYIKRQQAKELVC